jgi:NADP-dependent alcohol dehydrogenase
VPQDWASHMIGHEFTALYGIDHGQSLAMVLPGILQHQRRRKHAKLLQYADRVWGLRTGDEEARVTQAIERTEQFFRSLGIGTRFSDYNIPQEAVDIVAGRIGKRGMKLGEHGDVVEKDVKEVLLLRM